MDRFAGLNRHANQVARYRQVEQLQQLRDADAAVPPAMAKFRQSEHEMLKSGMCAGVSLEWMREKLTGSNSIFRRGPKNFVRTPAPGKLAKVSFNAAIQQYDHLNNQVSLKNLFQKNRMELTEMDGYNNKNKGPDNMPYTDLELTFTRLCRELRRGDGVVMRTTVDDTTGEKQPGGHATCLYKSHGGKTYFFDPNAGAYEVKNAAAFIKAWVDIYPGQGRAVSMRRDGDGFYQCTAT